MEIKNLKFGIFTLLLSLQAQAIDFVQTNRFIIADGQTVAEETWLSAEQTAISGTVSADLHVATKTAELAGIFQEDVWCIGETILAPGVFQNGARLVSKTVLIQGTVNGPLIAIGNTVKIDREAILDNGLFCAGENVIVEGDITGPVRVLAQNITLGGQITGDASLTAQEIVVLPGTVINGDLTYSAPEDLVLPASVVLNGTLSRSFEIQAPQKLLKDNLPAHVMFALAALTTGLVFAGLFPRYTGTAVHTLKNSTGLCSLIGFASLVMVPMAAFLMLITFIGSPLGILVLLFYGILLYLSKVVVAFWIGLLIMRRKEFTKQGAAVPLTLGIFVLYTLTAFTAASFPVNLAIIIFGLGALLTALFKKPVLVIKTDGLPPNTVT